MLILFGSVNFLNFAPTCNSFTDPTGSCFSYNLSSSSPPLGSFCSVQSPSLNLRLLSTLLLIHPVRALGTTSPEALTSNTPQGTFGWVQSLSPNLRPLATLLLIQPVHALATTSPAALLYNTPYGSFCSVQSPPLTLRRLATLLLMRPVRALGTTSPQALTSRLILFSSVTSLNLVPTCHSFTDPTSSCFS